MIFRVMILLALVKLLDMTNSPGLCTFLLAGIQSWLPGGGGHCGVITNNIWVVFLVVESI